MGLSNQLADGRFHLESGCRGRIRCFIDLSESLGQMNQLKQLIHNLDRARQGIGQLTFTIAKKNIVQR